MNPLDYLTDIINLYLYADKRGWHNWDCDCLAKENPAMRHAENCGVTPIYAQTLKYLGPTTWHDFPIWTIIYGV